MKACQTQKKQLTFPTDNKTNELKRHQYIHKAFQDGMGNGQWTFSSDSICVGMLAPPSTEAPNDRRNMS